ncbi:MAG: hypothetical protein HC929_13800 [Leptolyngbyaceae cyanobacterium SM2_5_2]|nr:hypothetical protein [Leptolyngbyaceae cyanobacterium SM2_5_2]
MISYQDSLNQGLNKMHTLGQQGEIMFSALINHLAQRLSPEALAYLESAGGAPPRPELPLANADRVGVASTEAPMPPDSVVDPDEGLNLDDLDLNADFGDEITLLQIDDQISQLDLDDEDADIPVGLIPGLGEARADRQADLELDDQPDYGTLDEPLQILDQLDVATPDPTAAVLLPIMPTADITGVPSPEGAGNEDLDEFYQSLFGLNQPLEGGEPSLLEDGMADLGSDLEPLTQAADNLSEFDQALGSPFQSEALTGLWESFPQSPSADAADSAPEPELGTLDNLLDPGLGAQLSSQSDISEAAEPLILASLDDLLPDPVANANSDLEDSLTADSGLGLDLNLPGVALPEEDLLVDDAALSANRYGLTVDDATANSLAEDLANLETTWASQPEPMQEFPQASPQPLDTPPSLEDFGISPQEPDPARDTLADLWGSPLAEPPAQATPQAPEYITEDLFGESFAEPPVPENPPVDQFGDQLGEQFTAAEFSQAGTADLFRDDITLPQPPEPPAIDLFGDQSGEVSQPPARVDNLWDSANESAPKPTPDTVDDLFAEREIAPMVSPEPTVLETPAIDRWPDPLADQGLSTADNLALILTELDFSLGPEVPIVGESGLTLDDLQALSADSPQIEAAIAAEFFPILEDFGQANPSPDAPGIQANPPMQESDALSSGLSLSLDDLELNLDGPDQGEILPQPAELSPWVESGAGTPVPSPIDNPDWLETFSGDTLEDLAGSFSVDNPEVIGASPVDNPEAMEPFTIDGLEFLGTSAVDNPEPIEPFTVDGLEFLGTSAVDNPEETRGIHRRRPGVSGDIPGR